MSHYRRTLKPSQIADLLRWLTATPFHGEIVRCWPSCQQAQTEGWADFEIHRLVIMDLERWPVGQPRKLPLAAQKFIVQYAYRNGSKVKKKVSEMMEASHRPICQQVLTEAKNNYAVYLRNR